MGYHKTILYGLVLNWLSGRNPEEPNYEAERETAYSSFVDPEVQREQDLQRYGTSQGIVNVSEAAADPQKTSPVCTTVLSSDQVNNQWSKDKVRYGTSQGVISVAHLKQKKFCYTPHLPKRPSNKRFETSYEQDLERFGTSQGIINVAQEAVKKQHKPKPKVQKADPRSINPYADIYKEFSKAQVTIHNKTSTAKEITLWGAKPEVYSEPGGFQNANSQLITDAVGTGIHPQGVCYNPANACTYIVNQLSGSVTVLDSSNQILATVQLDPSFPGMCSPTAVAINTNTASSKFGYAYVACSVSNSVAVIDTTYNVVKSIPVGVRPVALCFNPVNNLVYIANLVDNTVSVLDADTFDLHNSSPLTAGSGPIGVGVNPDNGELFVCNSTSNDLTVYNSVNQLLSTVSSVGQRPVSVSYNPANGYLYVAATNSNELLKIHPASHTIVMRLLVGRNPYNTFFLPVNRYLYVQNRLDDTLSVLDEHDQIVGTLNLGQQNIGGAFNPQNNSMYVTDTPNNTVNVITFGQAISSVSVSDNYAELQADFHSNIAIIQHARFVVTGTERLSGFRVNKKNVTGSMSIQRLSFEQFASPQNWQNVTECTALSGSVVDAKTNWKFMLPGLQTVSVLIWFKQLELLDLMPEDLHTNTLIKEKK